MATEKQIELFNRLVGQKNFGTSNVQQLMSTFPTLADKTASRWIERALELPDADDDDSPIPF